MKFILTKIPVSEDILVKAIRDYLRAMRFGEMYPHHANVNVSNDHPFERLLDTEGAAPDLFPAITVVASSDGEAPGMGKNWTTETLLPADVPADFDAAGWFLADSAAADLRTALATFGQVFGLSHSTTWRDSVSIEIWTENLQVKNDLYTLIHGFLVGPHALDLKRDQGLTIFSGQVQGQRSGYYNFDFGRVLYGARISFQADYSVIQSVYDSDIRTIADIEHSYREVLHG